jgi:hypothetical protein
MSRLCKNLGASLELLPSTWSLLLLLELLLLLVLLLLLGVRTSGTSSLLLLLPSSVAVELGAADSSVEVLFILQGAPNLLRTSSMLTALPSSLLA